MTLLFTTPLVMISLIGLNVAAVSILKFLREDHLRALFICARLNKQQIYASHCWAINNISLNYDPKWTKQVRVSRFLRKVIENSPSSICCMVQ